jgi:hypothetical protein
MNKTTILILGFILFSNNGFSQNQNSSKLDTLFLKQKELSQFKQSDSLNDKNIERVGIRNNTQKDLNIFWNNYSTSKSTKEFKMRIHKPIGNYKMRIESIDSTVHYSLKIVSPKKTE